VFENHFLSSNTTLASCDVTALVIIKSKEHQMLADPLLQSGIVTPVTILFIVLNDIVLIVFECAA